MEFNILCIEWRNLKNYTYSYFEFDHRRKKLGKRNNGFFLTEKTCIYTSERWNEVQVVLIWSTRGTLLNQTKNITKKILGTKIHPITTIKEFKSLCTNNSFPVTYLRRHSIGYFCHSYAIQTPGNLLEINHCKGSELNCFHNAAAHRSFLSVKNECIPCHP
jgi:hypothetical protein